MRKKDLIDVVLKIGGLFVLLQTISTNLTGSILVLLHSIDIDTLIFVAINILIISLIFYFFVLRTKIIIGLMKIDEDALVFENADINKSSILSIGITLIGVFILVNSIGNILIEATDLILSTMTTGNGHFDWYPFVYIILGSILIIKSDQIVTLINK